MIEKMLAAHVTMAGLYGMLNGLVSEAERMYCASGKAEDKRRWDKLMKSRASIVEGICHLAEAGGAEIITYGQLKRDETLNANSEAL